MALGTKRKASNILAQFPVNFPSGTVVPFAGATAPEGWALCNGDAVSRTEYASLFSAIGDAWGVGDGSTTFNLPDMRGQFLRGKNNGRDDGNEDPDGERALGSFQEDAYQEHTHQSVFYQSTDTGGSPNPYAKYDGSMADRGLIGPSVAEGFGTPRVGWETRPKNVAVNYIIKL